MIYFNRFVLCIIALISFGNLSCGIEEHYYLPQVPEPQRSFNTGASLFIPPDFLDGFYYATGYRIFYKIYRSVSYFGDYQNISIFQNSAIINDYNFFLPFTDPDTNSIINSRTFSNRGFFEVDQIIGVNAGTLTFVFPVWPGDIPTISINGASFNLRRSSNLTNIEGDDLYFRNTDSLRNPLATNNTDVASGQNEAEFAYVAMYIVAIGTNPQDFNLIVSTKPTFLNIFKLPDM
jgi:hypothetical protein